MVLGASGSVITDALGPYEVFARSPEFFVYTVSARPAAMLSGALAVVPDYSLSDVDAGTAGTRRDRDPGRSLPAGKKEQPLREWLARRAGRARSCSASAPGRGCWPPRAARRPPG